MAGLDQEVDPVIPSPLQFGSRSKITPHFAPPKEGRITEIGFLADSSRYRIVDVPHCDIAMPALNAKLAQVRDEVRANAARYRKAATLLLRASQANVLTQSSQTAVEIVDGIRFEFQ